MEWEEDEIKYLRENYRHGSCQAIAHKLGRGLRAIQQKANRIGIARTQKPWTGAEENLLREIYPRQQVVDTCKQLGRSRASVLSRVRVLGLKLEYDVYCESKHYYGKPAA